MRDAIHVRALYTNPFFFITFAQHQIFMRLTHLLILVVIFNSFRINQFISQMFFSHLSLILITIPNHIFSIHKFS